MENEIVSYDSAKNIIRRDLESMSRKFITIGYYLKMIRDKEMYRQDGFRDIWEFAQDTYGISKSTCSRWMAMNDKFSQDGNSPYLKEEYRDFGKSQLQEMLYLTDEQMEQARPDMTAKEIREIRKPEAPKIELKKPDETERKYLNNAAKRLISSWRVWFLQDFTNRVLQVDISPKEIKKKLEGKSKTFYFSTDKGSGHVSLFDDCVQVWNENNDCIGDFDWFYLAAAIQSMWNEVILEKAEKKTKPYDRGCITGKNPNGNCVCCGSIIPEGRQVCKECEAKAGMNREGYKDPTAEQALWGVRKEERVRALEEKYGVHRGDKISIQEVKRMEDQPGGKRMFTKTRKLKVVDLYKNFILLEDKLGYRENFLWQEFLQKWKR